MYQPIPDVRARTRSRAFTLIELVVVVIVIAVIAAITGVAYNHFVDDARTTAVRASAKQVDTGLTALSAQEDLTPAELVVAGLASGDLGSYLGVAADGATYTVDSATNPTMLQIKVGSRAACLNLGTEPGQTSRIINGPCPTPGPSTPDPTAPDPTAPEPSTPEPTTPPAPPSQFSATVLADNPDALYRLGDAAGTTMTDSSGNHRDGQYNGGATLGRSALLTNESDTAVRFGLAQNGQVPYDGSWMTRGAFTVEALVQLDATQDPARSGADVGRSIAARHAHPAKGGGMWDLTIFDGKVQFRAPANGTWERAESTTKLQPGVTYLVAATWDGTTRRVYIDGQLEASLDAPIGTEDQWGTKLTAPLSFGQLEYSYGWHPLEGELDEVAYWSTALPADKLAAHQAAR